MGLSQLTTPDTIDGYELAAPLNNWEPNFLAKWGRDGRRSYTTAIPSGGSETTNDMATDFIGNLYLVANQKNLDTLILGVDTLFSSNDNMFVAQYGNAYFCDSHTDIIVAEESILTVYPNPATATVHLAMNENIANIAIYNVTGQTIWDTSFGNTAQEADIDVHTLQPGLYLIKINNTIVRKFLKE